MGKEHQGTVGPQPDSLVSAGEERMLRELCERHHCFVRLPGHTAEIDTMAAFRELLLGAKREAAKRARSVVSDAIADDDDITVCVFDGVSNWDFGGMFDAERKDAP